MSTIKEIKQKYHDKIDLLDLELIISRVINKPREFVLTHPELKLNRKQELGIRKYVGRRMKGEPLAYILGCKEFYGLNFKVNKNTLIPRPETELMVDEALLHISHNMEHITIIDVGTGSGCIIITLAKLFNNSKFQIPNSKFLATDISKPALRVARQNAKLHKVNKKIKFLSGNLLKPILRNKKLQIDNCKLIIVANLPYLDSLWKNLLASSESAGLKYEPKIALKGGKDGLDLYQKLAKQIQSIKFINNNITIFCEIGHLQKREIEKIFSFAKKIKIKKDLRGLNRIVVVQL
jgi:release factor glutamine methyltransferase